MFLTIPLFNAVNQIEGWLDIAEADALMCATIQVCALLPRPHQIVEVGSFQGKSSVLLATILKSLSPKSKLFAIDPHEGNIGAQDQHIYSFPPTLDAFKRNVAANNLSEIVELIKDYSTNVKLDIPISLLFIDGLHDYQSVSLDFFHFEKQIRIGGLVAFHDYASYCPGVKRVVDEIEATKRFERVYYVKSIIILKKIHA